MGKVIKMPQKRIYKPDVNQKIKDGLANGKFTLRDLELAREINRQLSPFRRR